LIATLLVLKAALCSAASRALPAAASLNLFTLRKGVGVVDVGAKMANGVF
jgi:hypothetical protein